MTPDGWRTKNQWGGLLWPCCWDSTSAAAEVMITSFVVRDEEDDKGSSISKRLIGTVQVLFVAFVQGREEPESVC